MAHQKQKPLNYLGKNQRQGANPAGGKPGGNTNFTHKQGHRQFTRLKPDASSHVPPIAMYILGGFGVLTGLLTNGWQWFTTFSAMMMVMTPSLKQFDNRSQPLKYVFAAIIATAMQFGILLLIFKVDTRWKKDTYGQQLDASQKMKGYGVAFVEVVQHIDVVTAYGLISFGIDTFGDYTFVGGVLNGLDFPTTVFVTFLYAASLYCLSTIVFVRCIEYIGSGLAATARTLMHMAKQHP